ncbi:hypothetical protein MMC09_006675 [Bachmanniomyces sp. S44760]|nr:hypothetical protein [Bachmanniomyces sp. S44760]
MVVDALGRLSAGSVSANITQRWWVLRKGTLITNFVGPFGLASEISEVCTRAITENHPLGKGSLGCIWVVAFAILRTLAEQLDFVFEAFDPVIALLGSTAIPGLRNISTILEKSNKILLMDRYLLSLEEFSSFLVLVQRTHQEEPTNEVIQRRSSDISSFNLSWLRKRGNLEAAMTQNKIHRQQRLCASFSSQYEAFVQMYIQVISYNSAQITERLDSGRSVGERFAKIGMIVAGISCVVSPLSLLTSFYGMNVREFTSGANINLYDFWKGGVPVTLAMVVSFGLLAMWLFKGGPTPLLRRYS